MNVSDIFIKPIATEQSLKQTTDKNIYTFVVTKAAAKPEIKKAFETLFGVTVTRVHTVTMKGGKKRITGKKISYATKPNWKKAIITVKSGDSVDLFDFGGDKKETKKKDKKDKESKAKKK